MERNYRHPLDAITCNDSLSMLEAMIPYVEYPFKLPLALYIKMNEILRIYQAFQSVETITRYGLHQQCSSPLDMVCQMTGLSPELLRFMNSMVQNNETDQTAPDLHSFFPNGVPFQQPMQETPTDEAWEERLQHIFDEYDASSPMEEENTL